LDKFLPLVVREAKAVPLMTAMRTLEPRVWEEYPMMTGSIFDRSARAKMAAYLCGSATAIALLFLAMPGNATSTRPPADFEVLCQVLDAFGQENDEFRGGETAILRLLIKIPEDVYDDQIDVKVLAEIKVKGFKYRVKLPILDVDVPERPKRLNIDGYTPDLQEFTPFRQLDTFNDVDVDAQVAVKLPNNVPKTKFTLIALGSIKGGGQQTCKQKVRLVN